MHGLVLLLLCTPSSCVHHFIHYDFNVLKMRCKCERGDDNEFNIKSLLNYINSECVGFKHLALLFFFLLKIL